MRRFHIQEYETVNVDLVRAHQDRIYLIELALDGQVWTGTECLLAEPNVCGIPVGKRIAMGTPEPFSDQETEREALVGALRRLYKLASGRTLYLPQVGIGSGPYGLATHSPRIYRDLCQILADHFGYSQPSNPSFFVSTDRCASMAYHHQLFTEVCTRGGFYMSHFVAEKHGLTLEQLKSHCLVAGKELDAQGRLFPLHRPTYRWTCDE